MWGIPLLALLFITGLYLTFLLKGVQFNYLGYAFKQIVAKKRAGSKGDISAYDALMTSLAGAIGTGSIVGVATAISIGGFGSIFWMWVTALLGMATKYSESLLAVLYRQKDHRGEMIGGPMQYIELGAGWRPLALVFAALASVAVIGTGNLVQVNSIADAAFSTLGLSPWFTGTVVALLTGLVLIGGIKSIGRFASWLVPFMSLFYFIGAFVVLMLHLDKLPGAIWMILEGAFSPSAAVGGIAGGSLILVIQMGVARSVFSNEAGLGVSSISAAAAVTDNPGRQAMINMTGALFSTIIICTMTALVIAVTGAYQVVDETGDNLSGAYMAIYAFGSTLTGGDFVVMVGLILFAYSTVVAWAYYGEKCIEYLFGERAITPYRLLYTLLIIPGSALEMELVWLIADVMNGLMVIPNLLALLKLSPVIKAETVRFLSVVDVEIAKGEK